MVSTNPFDLLGDDDNDDPAQLLAKLPVTIPAAKKSPAGGVPAKPVAKLPSKPLPPAQPGTYIYYFISYLKCCYIIQFNVFEYFW